MLRKMKVYYVPGYAAKGFIPRIVLSGKYLERYGFDVSQKIMVEVNEGRIVIEPMREEDIVQTEKKKVLRKDNVRK